MRSGSASITTCTDTSTLSDALMAVMISIDVQVAAIDRTIDYLDRHSQGGPDPVSRSATRTVPKSDRRCLRRRGGAGLRQRRAGPSSLGGAFCGVYIAGLDRIHHFPEIADAFD